MKISWTIFLIVLGCLNVSILFAKDGKPVEEKEVKESYVQAIEAFNKGKYEDSLSHIRSVISSGHLNYELRYLAAHNHWKLNNLGPAISHLTNVVSQKPETSGAYIDLALAQIQAKKYKAARKTALSGIENLEDANKEIPAKLYSVLSRAELLSKRYKSALIFAQKAKAAESKKENIKDKVETLVLEARAQLALKNYDKAELAASWALSLKKDDPWLENLLGYIYEMKSGETGKDSLMKAKDHYAKSQTLSGPDSIKSVSGKNLQRVQKKIKAL